MTSDISGKQLSRLQNAVLAAVLVLGFGLRFHDLSAKSLWYDEGSTMSYARNLHSVKDALDTTFTNDPPVFPLLVHLWEPVVRAVEPDPMSPRSDFLLRLLPFTFGLASMVLVFIVGRLLLNSTNAGLFAAFLYAISPFQIRYAQELRTYSLLTLLGLAGLYFFVKALRDNRNRDWAGLALLEVLLLYTHFFSAWFILTINLYFVLSLVIQRDLRMARIVPWLMWQSAAVVLSIPSLLMLRDIMQVINSVKYHWYQMVSFKIGLIAFKAFFAGFSPNALAYWPLFVLAACLFLFGLYSARRTAHASILLAMLVAVPLLGNIVMAKINGFSLFELRLFILNGVAACMAVGAGLSALPRRWMQLVAVCAMALLTIPLALDYYGGRLHSVEAHRVAIWDKPDVRSAAAYIMQHAGQGDVVGHAGHGTLVPMQYYCSLRQVMLGHSNVDRQVMVDNFGSEHQVRRHNLLAEPIQEVAAQAPRIWFLETSGLTFDWRPQVMMIRTWLETNALREDYQVFDGVSLTCYKTQVPMQPRALRDVLADYGDAPLVRYRFGDGSPDGQAARAYKQYVTLLCDTFGVEFDLSLSAPDRGEAVSRDDSAGDALYASIPSMGTDEFTYTFEVVNRSDISRSLRCTILESAGALEPLAWIRDEPMTAPWRPVPQYDSDTQGTFNRPSMVAFFQGEHPASAVMEGWAALPAGLYRPYARVFEEPAASLGTRAVATFALSGGATVLGSLDGAAPDSFGWHWRPLGEMHADNGLVQINVAAANARHFPDAYFNLEKILFVPVTEARPGAPVAQQFDVALGPHERKPFTMKGTVTGYARKRMDIEVFDPASRMYRSVVFHVENGAQAR